MHFDVVLTEFISPCSKIGGELNLVFVQLTRLSVCMRFRCVCVRFRCACTENFSHGVRLFRQQSRAFYMLASCLQVVLISSPGTWDWTWMHTLVVIHRRTLCENVDSAKIKVPFYTTDIDILYFMPHRCILSSYIVSIHIDESLHP